MADKLSSFVRGPSPLSSKIKVFIAGTPLAYRLPRGVVPPASDALYPLPPR
jgi:hypothetical protein